MTSNRLEQGEEVESLIANHVVVQGKITTRPETNIYAAATGNTTKLPQHELTKKLSYLEAELDAIKNSICYRIDGEMSTVRQYVDQAIRRDHLTKRP
jgi:hypothetical protein